MPSSCCSRRISSRRFSRTLASSADSGSSRSSTRGRRASARASATRCCWPPESWCGKLLALVGEAHEVEQLGGAGPPFGRTHLAHPHPEGHVVEGAEVREEAVRLEDHAGVPAVGRDLGDVLTVDQHLTGVGVFEPGEHAQRGGLAAAGGAEQREQLPRPHGEVESVEGDGRAELPAQAPEFDSGGFVERHVVHPLAAAVRERPPSPASARRRAQVTSRLSTETATDSWACEPPTL